MDLSVVIAVIRSNVLEKVEQGLREIDVRGISVSKVKGYGEYHNFYLKKEMIMKRIASTIASLALLALAALSAHAADTKDMPGTKMDAGKATAGLAHKGQGTVNRVDEKAGKINLAHGPIPSLNWPAMTMDFQVKDKALLKGVTPGQKVEFDIAQQGPGRFVITRIAPSTQQPALSAPANSDTHKGH